MNFINDVLISVFGHSEISNTNVLSIKSNIKSISSDVLLKSNKKYSFREIRQYNMLLYNKNLIDVLSSSRVKTLDIIRQYNKFDSEQEFKSGLLFENETYQYLQNCKNNIEVELLTIFWILGIDLVKLKNIKALIDLRKCDIQEILEVDIFKHILNVKELTYENIHKVKKNDKFQFVMVHFNNDKKLKLFTNSIKSLTCSNLNLGANMLLKLEVDDYGIDTELMIFFHTLVVKFEKLIVVHPPPLNVSISINCQSKRYIYIYLNSYAPISNDNVNTSNYVTEEFVDFVYNTNNFIIKLNVIDTKCIYDSVRLQRGGFKSDIHEINPQLKKFISANMLPTKEEFYPTSPEYNSPKYISNVYSVNSPTYLDCSNLEYNSPQYNSPT